MFSYSDSEATEVVYREGLEDIVCYPLAEKERRWKFDTKNEMGFYLGDKKGMKGTSPTTTRSLPHRVRISEIELMEWYG